MTRLVVRLLERRGVTVVLDRPLSDEPEMVRITAAQDGLQSDDGLRYGQWGGGGGKTLASGSVAAGARQGCQSADVFFPPPHTDPEDQEN